MIRNISLMLAGAIFAVVSMTVISEGYLSISNAQAADTNTYRDLSIFGDVFERVRSQYVTKPDDEKLVESAIKGMLTSLDPHSSYMNAEDYKEMREGVKGEFGGLGIEVTMDKELIKVVTPIEDTPAAKAGVLSGDLISKIDGEEVRGLTLREAVDKMRGPVNTPIELTILREGASKPIKVTIIRGNIEISPVKHRVIDDNIGYIRITSFTEKTYDGLEKAIKDIKEKVPEDKLKGYILDLRLNPGGLLDQAIAVSDAFLDRGLVVSTRGRNVEEGRRHSARPGDLTGGKPLIVLINGGSASASEIVAGALQDHKRATIVGTRSFGKGSVQTIIPLGTNGGALRLTTALYYTPSDRSIQGKGITPDIKVIQPLPEELKGRVEPQGESGLRGHIQGNEEDEEGSGSIAYVPPEQKDDIQLNDAIDLLEGTKKDKAFPPDPNAAVSAKKDTKAQSAANEGTSEDKGQDKSDDKGDDKGQNKDQNKGDGKDDTKKQ